MTTKNNNIILGVDIGGTGIKSALVNVNEGTLLTEVRKSATPQPATSRAVITLMKDLVIELNWKGSIGCGFPGTVKDGIVQMAVNLAPDWAGMNVCQEIQKLTNQPVGIVNDADAAAIAEMRFGAGAKRNKHGGGVVLLLTLGTGIGSALFINGHLLPNTEFGQVYMEGIEAEKRAATVIRERENLSWNEWGSRVNQYLNMMNILLSPDCIIIGGGISESPEKFFHYLDADVEILPAEMGNDAGIIGAALVVETEN